MPTLCRIRRTSSRIPPGLRHLEQRSRSTTIRAMTSTTTPGTRMMRIESTLRVRPSVKIPRRQTVCAPCPSQFGGEEVGHPSRHPHGSSPSSKRSGSGQMSLSGMTKKTVRTSSTATRGRRDGTGIVSMP